MKENIPSGFSAELMQARQNRERNKPVALFEMLQEEEAARLLFDGLMLHYLECFGQQRLDIWAKSAHAIVDLIAHPNNQIHKR